MSKVMYTCPMHPDVLSDLRSAEGFGKASKPGSCPKCGMALVAKNETSKPVVHQSGDKGLGTLTWRSYVPLIVIVLLITIVSTVVSWDSQFPFRDFMLSFMTGFFLVFTGFKLMDLKGFAEGYSTYDLLAQKWFGYGYTYPFIELAFGFLMLAGYHPDGLLWTEFGIMAFSGVGVAVKVAKREPFMCACLGTFLKVPLTYITLVEDFGMAVLALVLIFLT